MITADNRYNLSPRAAAHLSLYNCSANATISFPLHAARQNHCPNEATLWSLRNISSVPLPVRLAAYPAANCPLKHTHLPAKPSDPKASSHPRASGLSRKTVGQSRFQTHGACCSEHQSGRNTACRNLPPRPEVALRWWTGKLRTGLPRAHHTRQRRSYDWAGTHRGASL